MPILCDNSATNNKALASEALAKLKSGDVVLRARSPRGGPERQIRLRCVTEPDEPKTSSCTASA